MKWLWTWGGTSFGYRDGDDLWTHDGRDVAGFTEMKSTARMAGTSSQPEDPLISATPNNSDRSRSA